LAGGQNLKVQLEESVITGLHVHVNVASVRHVLGRLPNGVNFGTI
jgi:hypothetical protein